LEDERDRYRKRIEHALNMGRWGNQPIPVGATRVD